MQAVPRERILRIITAFAESNATLTSKALATFLGVSAHTVRNDMKEAREWILAHGGDILAKPRSGYVLQVHDKKKWQSFCTRCQSMKRQEEALTAKNERMNYIIAKILLSSLHQERMSQWDLADELFIGLTTLKNYWKDIKKDLSKHGLQLKADKADKIRIEGGEEKIRKAISELLFTQMSAGNISLNPFYRDIFSAEEIKKVREIVMHAVTRHNIVLSDTTFQGIVIHILIILRRLNTRMTIEYPAEEISFLKTTKSFIVSQEIITRISQWMNVNIENEVYYLAEHFMASERFLTQQSDEAGEAKRLVMEILEQINRDYAVHLLDDSELVTGLQIHLEAAIHRLRFNIGIRNEILQVIKKDFPLAFEFAVIASQIIERQANIKTNENEIGFLAVHFGAAMERKRYKKHTCILVCGTGMTTAMLIREKLLRRFNGYLEIKKMCPLYELTESDVDEADFVFSTLPIPSMDSPKIICVSPVLSDADMETIGGVLMEAQKSSLQDVQEEFFHEELFFPHLKASSRKEILDQLTQTMLDHGYIDDMTRKSIYEREEISPTEIGALLAMPHALKSNAAVPAIAVAILEKPICWVQEMVQVIFVLSIPKEKYKLWEPIFRKIYQYFVCDLGARELIETRDYELLLRKLVQ